MVSKALLIGVAFAFVVVTSGLGGSAAQAQERPRLAVVAFKNPTGWWGRELGASAASQLTTKLVNSGAFNMLERDRVKDVLDEWYLASTGAVNVSTAAPTGQLKGVEYLVTGEFKSFSIKQQGGTFRIPGTGTRLGGGVTVAHSAINVRVISVTTGELIAAAESTGDKNIGKTVQGGGNSYSTVTSSSPWNPTVAEDALGEALDKIAAAIVSQREKFPTTAAPPAEVSLPTIVRADAGGSVYIDHGQNRGVTVGRRYGVVRVVDVIKDASGKELDKITKRVGTIEVTQVLSQSSICKVIDGKPAMGDALEAN